MYYSKGVWITLGVLSGAAMPLLTAWLPLVPADPAPLKIYPGNHAFRHAIGTRHRYGWEAYFRHHKPGYLAAGLQNGGEALPEGLYRMDAYLARRPGHLTGLLSGANDVVRLEVVDTTTQEILAARTFQEADLQSHGKKLRRKSLPFSMVGRPGHRVEPRLYWAGLSAIFLQRIEIVPLRGPSPSDLAEKAALFESIMPDAFLERGFVVTRNAQGKPADVNDAAIWTGLYVAAQAWRYQATLDPQALHRMETSLRALHQLYRSSPKHGTLVRFVQADGTVVQQSPSKDTYTGFFYATAQALPFVRDPDLRHALQSDIDALATVFWAKDLSFPSPVGGDPVDMNPTLGGRFLRETIDALQSNPGLRHRVIRAIRLASWYFWLHGERPPASFPRMIKTLKHPEGHDLQAELLVFVNDLRDALRMVHRQVRKSAWRGTRQGLMESPYAKLDRLLMQALDNLDQGTQGRPFTSFDQLQVLPSESLHALHFLKVAASVLPKPNRFEALYRANLYEGKSLLRTALQWHQWDEDLQVAALGQTEANTRRTASCHLSFLALHDLILVEGDPAIRQAYQHLFDAQYRPMSADGNAMIDAMQVQIARSPKERGLAEWALGRYPTDRRGKGERFWYEHRDEILAAYGGTVNGQAREPLPPDLRPRDAFLWQRSAHSIRGDHEGWLYPPLDYLYAYWLTRTRSSEPPAQN